jgi:hypothetical protein
MEKYNLFLKTISNELPTELMIENVFGPRVPIKGEIITSMHIKDYIEKVAIKEKCTKYITNFSYSRFIVDGVEHIPNFKRGKIEVLAIVTALKI